LFTPIRVEPSFVDDEWTTATVNTRRVGHPPRQQATGRPEMPATPETVSPRGPLALLLVLMVVLGVTGCCYRTTVIVAFRVTDSVVPLPA
jgi:hypothetical protein